MHLCIAISPDCWQSKLKLFAKSFGNQIQQNTKTIAIAAAAVAVTATAMTVLPTYRRTDGTCQTM